MGRIVLDKNVRLVVTETGLRADMRYDAQVIDSTGSLTATGPTPASALRAAAAWYTNDVIAGLRRSAGARRKVAAKSGRRIT